MAAVSFSSLASGQTVTFTENSSVTFSGQNTSANFTKNIALTNVTIEDDRLEADEGSFMVENTNGADINMAFSTYSPSASTGNDAYNFETSEGQKADMTFTGLKQDTSYALKKGGSAQTYKNSGGNGQLTFTIDDFSATYAITIAQSSRSSSDDQRDFAGSSSSSSDQKEPASAGKSWIDINGTSFSFDVDGQVPGIMNVSFSTGVESSPQSMDVREVETNEIVEKAEEADNAERYYEITASGVDKEKITQVKYVFSPNSSWAANQDDIVFSRYNEEGWEDLETERLENQENFYVAYSDRFSYYAIRGVTGEGGDNNQTDIESFCGDGICEDGEGWQNCSSDCEKPQEVIDAENALAGAQQEVGEEHPGYKDLQEAQQAFDDGNYSQAEQLAQSAMDADDEIDTTLLIGGVAIVIVLLLGIAVLLLKKRD